eukprot:13766633-Alexandrium_andersonii.AAC.1
MADMNLEWAGMTHHMNSAHCRGLHRCMQRRWSEKLAVARLELMSVVLVIAKVEHYKVLVLIAGLHLTRLLTCQADEPELRAIGCKCAWVIGLMSGL